jgi:plastocyanin
MDRRAFLATVGTSTVALAGCLGAGGPTDGDDHDIGMSSSAFKPASFAVAPGTTVVWRNTSSHAHTVTAYESGIPDDADFFASGDFSSSEAAREGWKSGTQGSIHGGETYEHEFTVPGTYNYFCIPHETNGMKGVIEVTQDATRTPEGGRVTLTNATTATNASSESATEGDE